MAKNQPGKNYTNGLNIKQVFRSFFPLSAAIPVLEKLAFQAIFLKREISATIGARVSDFLLTL